MVLTWIVGSLSFFKFRMTMVIRKHCVVLTSTIMRHTFKLPNMSEGYNISDQCSKEGAILQGSEGTVHQGTNTILQMTFINRRGRTPFIEGGETPCVNK